MQSKITKPNIFIILLLIWAILVMTSVIITLATTKDTINHDYDLQIEASTKTKACFEAIKEYKKINNIEISEEDKYDCGMIGIDYSEIQTTSGEIKAKLTACNPNFSALYIKVFQELDIKKGDEVAIIMSGSFPTLNIAAIVACEVYGIKTCLMGSIGSSTYGANNPEFNFYDMIEYLCDKNLIHSHLDYVSFGGDNDTGYEYPKDVSEAIKARFDQGSSVFLSEPDFEKNVKERTQLIYKKIPNVKLLISIGGTLVAMGRNADATISYKGLVKPNYLLINKKNLNNIGLLDTFLNNNVPIFQMLSIRDIAYDYGIAYDPDVIPEIGQGDIYYEKKYNLVLPIITIIFSIGMLTYIIVVKKRKEKRDELI